MLLHGGVTVSPDLALGTIDSWIIWNLTGGEVHATDATNASRTMLFDIGSLGNGTPTCARSSECPQEPSPRCSPPAAASALPAPMQPAAREFTISGVAGDQHAALFGQAAFAPGDAKNTYGTGSFVLMNVGPDVPPPADGLLTTVAWLLDTPRGSGGHLRARGGDLRYRCGGAVAA